MKIMNRTQVKRAVAAASIAAAAVVLSIAGAAPATAAGSCGAVGYNQASGGASVSCTAGSYTFRVKVKCNAVWPLTSWTKYSGWATMTVHSGASWYWGPSVFPSCPSPATYSASVQYG